MTFQLGSDIFQESLRATSMAAVEGLLRKLPINETYTFNRQDPANGWKDGMLHYVPVGFEPGNAGRIKLGAEADNRIAERVVNMAEALIELERRRELKREPNAAPPASPRAAVERYFDIPRLDQIPELNDNKATYKRARDLARKLRVRVIGTKADRAIVFEDDGIGQAPTSMHSTILSLGGDNKIKEPYLIGMWGQGGSSAFAASQYTWIASCRAPDLGDAPGIGWTLVREIHPKDSRRSYYAYLAAEPTGQVASVAATTSVATEFGHGTRIGHVGFDLGTLDPMKLYQALNHVLPNPVLPFQINTRKEPNISWDACWGIGYLLTKLRAEGSVNMDKRFDAVSVGTKGRN